MSEENIKKQIKRRGFPSVPTRHRMAPEGVFLKSATHPRAYGNFARLLGKYVREEKVISLAEAVRSSDGPAGDEPRPRSSRLLKEGMFADVVVFDPQTIADRATFEKPHQYAVGVKHVFVNGVAGAEGRRAHRREAGPQAVRAR